MTPRIETIAEKKFAGHNVLMSYAQNRTAELWRGFMPRKNEITTLKGEELYSIEEYPEGFFRQFSPDTPFKKWAALEVSSFDPIPDHMETLTSPSGLYAIFLYQGPASEGEKMYQYIFTTWLPASDYVLDNRPHFAVMGEKYKHNDPDSEEELWIPVRPK